MTEEPRNRESLRELIEQFQTELNFYELDMICQGKQGKTCWGCPIRTETGQRCVVELLKVLKTLSFVDEP